MECVLTDKNCFDVLLRMVSIGREIIHEAPTAPCGYHISASAKTPMVENNHLVSLHSRFVNKQTGMPVSYLNRNTKDYRWVVTSPHAILYVAKYLSDNLSTSMPQRIRFLDIADRLEKWILHRKEEAIVGRGNLANPVTRWRMKNNLTAAQLAKKVGVTRAAWSKLEHGKIKVGKKWKFRLRELTGNDDLYKSLLVSKTNKPQPPAIFVEAVDAFMKMNATNGEGTQEGLLEFLQMNQDDYDDLMARRRKPTPKECESIAYTWIAYVELKGGDLPDEKSVAAKALDVRKRMLE